MKTFKMILFIAALLSMPIVAFIVGAKMIGVVFVIFYCIFGLVEWYGASKLGKTVTQDTQLLTKGKLIALTVAMVVGWSALIIHLWGLL